MAEERAIAEGQNPQAHEFAKRDEEEHQTPPPAVAHSADNSHAWMGDNGDERQR
jgi:hypothetical protein